MIHVLQRLSPALVIKERLTAAQHTAHKPQTADERTDMLIIRESRRTAPRNPYSGWPGKWNILSSCCSIRHSEDTPTEYVDYCCV